MRKTILYTLLCSTLLSSCVACYVCSKKHTEHKLQFTSRTIYLPIDASTQQIQDTIDYYVSIGDTFKYGDAVGGGSVDIRGKEARKTLESQGFNCKDDYNGTKCR